MNLSALLSILEGTAAYTALDEALRERAADALPLTLIQAARPMVLAALQNTQARPVLVITGRADRARTLAAEVAAWSTDPASVFHFAEPDPLFYEHIPWTNETVASRLAALTALAYAGREGEPPAPLVVAPVRAFLQKTVPPEVLRQRLLRVRAGAVIPIRNLLQTAVGLGYQSEALVEFPGSFSHRGGIVDLWPPIERQPLRLEYIGDEIESIRRFDPEAQRSRESVAELNLTPASEVALEGVKEALQAFERLDLANCHPVAQSAWESDRVRLGQGTTWRGVEYYLPFFYPQAGSLLDHLPAGGLVVLEDWQDLEGTAMQLDGQAEEIRSDLEGRREAPRGLPRPYFTWDELRPRLLERLRLLFDYQALGESFELPFSPGERFGGQLDKVLDEVVKRRNESAASVILTRQSERIAERLREREVYAKPKKDLAHAPGAGEVVLIQGALSEGFALHDGPQGTLFLDTDAELFGWARPKPRRAVVRKRPVTPEAFFADLAVGDYIVHMDHGIGVFRGLVKMAAGGAEREYLQVEYAQGDMLYVPVHQMDRVARYVAPGGGNPALHRLGTAEWNQVKERTQKAIASIAHDLLDLYAAREIVPGHAFPTDTTWQHELEASFPYVETDDQLTAIQQVKDDMERARPMDRLVVGDVGYGKTEVALRAAFKAVMDNKQVAVLVPTTVLAQQHYNNFRERLAPFPVEIEMLSRFRSEGAQDQILAKLKGRGIDIVIGTHRLLSSDVQFRDLGLLIIDEEQRFGVTHKERLKQWRQTVDVLTLTATPIPRTLYMSLSGVREMSRIETPPEERLPIRTVVTTWDDRLVRDAILRELDRGGQVYVVHNRVQGINILTEQLRKLVPEASFVVAHGQMPDEQLAQVMQDFAACQADVLVCTTIIESGIDIPNVNTILINRADKFGLAQLYQLRGRVGRSAARAYAYFLHDKDANLSEEARARLQTIAEATELGAGFQIAQRDLEIRGAGELLGAEQHGHMAAIGFDLYCRLLASAIQEQRGALGGEGGTGATEPGAVPRNGQAGPAALPGTGPTIDLPVQAEIPADYVQDGALRLRLYRRIAEPIKPDQVKELENEFRDRFGPLPESAQELLFLIRVKGMALKAKVAAISMESGRIQIRFVEGDEERAQRLGRRFGTWARVARDRLWLSGPDADPKWRDHLLDVLTAAAP